LRTYSWMARRLPGLSFTSKITLAGLVIVHVPLLAVIAIALTDPGSSALAISLSALAATALATVAMVAVLRGLSAPLQMAGRHIADYLAHGRLPPQIRIGDDEAGRLLHDVAILCARIEHQRVVLERLALQDPLTGINNRRGGETLLARDSGPLRDRRQPLSIAVVDVDELRELNAEGGHALGDQGLRRVAQELESVLRADDWVARWGGDEFLVVCHCAAADMVAVMDRVRQELGTTRKGREHAISVSIGVAQLADSESMDACIARADAALYAAKDQGRDSVRAAG